MLRKKKDSINNRISINGRVLLRGLSSTIANTSSDQFQAEQISSITHPETKLFIMLASIHNITTASKGKISKKMLILSQIRSKNKFSKTRNFRYSHTTKKKQEVLNEVKLIEQLKITILNILLDLRKSKIQKYLKTIFLKKKQIKTNPLVNSRKSWQRNSQKNKSLMTSVDEFSLTQRKDFIKQEDQNENHTKLKFSKILKIPQKQQIKKIDQQDKRCIQGFLNNCQSNNKFPVKESLQIFLSKLTGVNNVLKCWTDDIENQLSCQKDLQNNYLQIMLTGNQEIKSTIKEIIQKIEIYFNRNCEEQNFIDTIKSSFVIERDQIINQKKIQRRSKTINFSKIAFVKEKQELFDLEEKYQSSSFKFFVSLNRKLNLLKINQQIVELKTRDLLLLLGEIRFKLVCLQKLINKKMDAKNTLQEKIWRETHSKEENNEKLNKLKWKQFYEKKFRGKNSKFMLLEKMNLSSNI